MAAARKLLLCFWADERGQDMIEYALMAAAVAISAGAILPPVAPSVSAVFSKFTSLVSRIP